ncbi:MAG: hypothetical protein K2V38_25465 [Gemmataceae bacterium]|nr:hypothetical protein [Gemmataceae bacterium]
MPASEQPPREPDRAGGDVPEVQALRLVTVYCDGSTSMVSIAHRVVVADFDGEHPQVGIPHLDFDHRHEQQAGQEYWRDEWAGEDEGFPGWAAVFDYIERHPNALES